MFDRERTQVDTDIDSDIEFDFFDDAPTTEAPRETAPPRIRRRVPRGPAGPGRPSPELVRLIVLIAAAIVLVVILVLAVKSCQAGQKRAEYQDYMDSVGRIAGQSERVGASLNSVITTPGIRLPDLQARLNGLRQQQAQLVTSAEGLKPPGALREQQESLVEALQFRVSGLAGLTGALTTIDKGTAAGQAGRNLAEQAERLAASDVIYQDLFYEGSRHVLAQEGVTGVAIPTSDFLHDADLASPHSWALIVQRITQTPTSGGLHGNSIDGVKVEPGDQQLSASTENTVTASEDLSFHVLVKNSGDSQETQVKVSLTIQQSPQPVKRSQTIDLINPGESKTVVFGNLPAPSFGQKTTVQVTVEPVPGEKTTSNNTVEYPVVFTLG